MPRKKAVTTVSLYVILFIKQKEIPALNSMPQDHLEVKYVPEKVLPFNQMPGPKGLPLIGTLWDLYQEGWLQI